PRDEASPDPVVCFASFCLTAIVALYLAWHWGGTERGALTFAMAVTGLLAGVILWRANVSRAAVAAAAGCLALTVWSVVSAWHSASPGRSLPGFAPLLWYGLLVMAGSAAVRAGAGRACAAGLVLGGAVQSVVGLYDRWGA